MLLVSTRNQDNEADALSAVLKGIAEDGGLYVPRVFPRIKPEDMRMFADVRYADLAAEILYLFFDEMPREAVFETARKGYASFDHGKVAPIRKLDASEYMLELWHGPTSAFKDMALQVLPGLLRAAKEHCMEGKKTLILVATSGDTGKAALEGFKNAPGVEIVVFYPDEGVSSLQKLQMVTQEGENTHVAAVRGNFDDAQAGVKAIFADTAYAEALAQRGYTLSSANSINFGRLAPQVAYYVSAYAQLLKSGDIAAGEPVNFAVPTGNFGNILAAYYAKRMGLPVSRLICASNRNNVLTDFFKTGEYRKNRTFYRTSSPSMDILVSSNLERLLFEVTGRREAAVSDWMRVLKEQGAYRVDEASFDMLNRDFYAGWSGEERVFAAIRSVFEKHRYLIDPHTAVAQAVYEEYRQKTGDETRTVVISTASPYKFCPDVLRALGEHTEDKGDIELIERMYELSGMQVPAGILDLMSRPLRHTAIVDKADMQKAVDEMLFKR